MFASSWMQSSLHGILRILWFSSDSDQCVKRDYTVTLGAAETVRGSRKLQYKWGVLSVCFLRKANFKKRTELFFFFFSFSRKEGVGQRSQGTSDLDPTAYNSSLFYILVTILFFYCLQSHLPNPHSQNFTISDQRLCRESSQSGVSTRLWRQNAVSGT